MPVFIVSLIFAILLEVSVTTLPLTLLIILFLAVMKQGNEVFLIAFLAGLALDIFGFGRLGFSSLYFTFIVFLVYLYQKKFEIETVHFMILFSFFGSLIYLFLEGTGNFVFQSIFSTFLVFISFMVFRKFNKKIPTYAPE
jgi:rod shape-determining protein MreD